MLIHHENFWAKVQVSEPVEQTPVGPDQFADEKDLERAIREHGAAMLSVARRLLINEDDTRECVQEAYLLAFARISSFEGRSSFRTWLHRIVVNSALGILRSRKRHNTQSIDDLLPVFDSDGCRIEPTWQFNEPLSKILELNETRDLVRCSIENLPDKYRIVLMLRDIEGYDTEEVATLLGTNTGVIKTRLHRARAALKKQLEPLFEKGAL